MSVKIDKIYVINRIDRSDRAIAIYKELVDNDFIHRSMVSSNLLTNDFQFWPAIEDNENGVVGLNKTLHNLFDFVCHAPAHLYQNILIFEDDAKFCHFPQQDVDNVLNELPPNYEILYLGLNAYFPFDKRVSASIIKLKGAFALHAVLYSRAAILKIRDYYDNTKDYTTPADVIVNNLITCKDHSYCTYPMLVTQRNGYSDIEKVEMKYSRRFSSMDKFQQRYQEKLNLLMETKEEIKIV